MTAPANDRLILTIPPDPGYLQLTRLAALHFLKVQGMASLDARREARAVEDRSRSALKKASRGARSPRPLALTCCCARGRLNVALSGGAGGRKSSLLAVRVPGEDR